MKDPVEAAGRSLKNARRFAEKHIRIGKIRET